MDDENRNRPNIWSVWLLAIIAMVSAALANYRSEKLEARVEDLENQSVLEAQSE